MKFFVVDDKEHQQSWRGPSCIGILCFISKSVNPAAPGWGKQIIEINMPFPYLVQGFILGTQISICVRYWWSAETGSGNLLWVFVCLKSARCAIHLLMKCSYGISTPSKVIWWQYSDGPTPINTARLIISYLINNDILRFITSCLLHARLRPSQLWLWCC